MFKSKARKQAEFELKVEKEKEKLQQQQVARRVVFSDITENVQKLILTIFKSYRATYRRNPKVTMLVTLVVGLFVFGSAVSDSQNTSTQTVKASSQSDKNTISTPKNTIVTLDLTPAFADEKDFKVWYSVVNYQTQPPEIIDQLKEEGRMYFILPNETIEVLSTYECLSNVECHTVNSEGVKIIKGIGSPPFENITNNKLWIPANYINQVAQENSSNEEIEAPTAQDDALLTSTNDNWGTLHSQEGKINLRSGSGTTNKVIGYGINGDRVQILDSTNDRGGYIWYKVQFPESGAVGWIAGQLIRSEGYTSSTNESDVALPSEPEKTNIINARCSDFASQAEAQAALPTNPQLDRDKDGIACESLL